MSALWPTLILGPFIHLLLSGTGLQWLLTVGHKRDKIPEHICDCIIFPRTVINHFGGNSFTVDNGNFILQRVPTV